MPERSTFEVTALFGTPVIVAQVADARQLNAELEAAIIARRAQDPGVALTNVGGWHSRTDFFDWAGEAGMTIGRHVIELADGHTIDTAPPTGGRRGWRLDAWANVIDGAGEHVPHIHPGAYWSAVYYVRADAGEGGLLEFHDPRAAMNQMHAPTLRMLGGGDERSVTTAAEPGKLVLFPSWLTHGVTPYRGDGRRISVAINLAAGG